MEHLSSFRLERHSNRTQKLRGSKAGTKTLTLSLSSRSDLCWSDLLECCHLGVVCAYIHDQRQVLATQEMNPEIYLVPVILVSVLLPFLQTLFGINLPEWIFQKAEILMSHVSAISAFLKNSQVQHVVFHSYYSVNEIVFSSRFHCVLSSKFLPSFGKYICVSSPPSCPFSVFISRVKLCLVMMLCLQNSWLSFGNLIYHRVFINFWSRRALACE